MVHIVGYGMDGLLWNQWKEREIFLKLGLKSELMWRGR